MRILTFLDPSKRKASPVGKLIISSVGAIANKGRNFKQLSEEGYKQNAIAFACINKLAKAVSSVELELQQLKSDGEYEVVKNHEILSLLEQPNPMLRSYTALTTHVISNLLITGNLFVIADDFAGEKSKPMELWTLDPAKVKIEQGDKGMPLNYIFESRGGKIKYPVDQITGASQVLHCKYFNPTNDWWGLPPLEAAAYSADTFKESQKWNFNLLHNGATPSGALYIKEEDGVTGNLTSEQRDQLKIEFTENYASARNAGRPVILEGGLEWKEMGITPKDMEYSKSQDKAADYICSTFDVPPMLIGLERQSTYNNMAEAKLQMWQDAVIPLLDFWIEALNYWLLPRYEGSGRDRQKYRLSYDENRIPALEPRREILFGRAQNATFLTENEKRKMCGFDNNPQGDVWLVDANKVPIEEVGLLPPTDDISNSDEE